MNAHVGRTSAIQFGARSLLAFALEPVAPIEEWFPALDAWLARSPGFFAGKPVLLNLAGLDIGLKAYRELLSQLSRRHIRVMAVENAPKGLVGPHLPPCVDGGRAVGPERLFEDESRAAPAVSAPQRLASLVHEGHLRSGQRLLHLESDVTVLGRVGSGAEVVAGGSVHIYGALRGRVFAGVSDGANARIFCREARAELICIGGAFITSEDMDPKLEGRAVEARLVGDRVAIRALN